MIWSKTQEEQKLKPEEEEKLDGLQAQAESLALAAISLSDCGEKEKIKMNEKMQMKIKDQWESQTSTYQNTEADQSKSRPIKTNTSVWEIQPEEQVSYAHNLCQKNTCDLMDILYEVAFRWVFEKSRNSDKNEG